MTVSESLFAEAAAESDEIRVGQKLLRITGRCEA